eukprot:5442147-Pleurochrysis_carterae.AAC.1
MGPRQAVCMLDLLALHGRLKSCRLERERKSALWPSLGLRCAHACVHIGWMDACTPDARTRSKPIFACMHSTCARAGGGALAGDVALRRGALPREGAAERGAIETR